MIAFKIPEDANIPAGTNIIQLGLCCLNTQLREHDVFCSRTIRLDTFLTKGFDHLKPMIFKNLQDLKTMIEWNFKNGIKVMRISSDLFPHMSNHRAPTYSLDHFQDVLSEIGQLSRTYGQRLTFHPGQYNVVGTPHMDKFENTVRDLSWHADVLDRMGCDRHSVMVVHGGGTYGDKSATMERWIKQFEKMPEHIKRRLVLENCEKNFSIEDCLYISSKTDVPVVFDTHHYDCYNLLHPKDKMRPAAEYIPAILATWAKRDIKPKFHVSEQRQGSKTGAHSDFIDSIPDYLLKLSDIDIMIEAKMKEQAVFRLIKKYAPKIKLRLKLKSQKPIEITGETETGTNLSTESQSKT